MLDNLPQRRVKAPGLIWVKRRGSFTPYWIARDADRKAGFRPKTVNLSRFAGDPKKLAERCDALWAEMLEWRSARPANTLQFDGTLRSLFILYQFHPQSTYRRLSPASRCPYDLYLSHMVKDIGDRMVDSISGLDLLNWHNTWSNAGVNLAASAMCRAVLDAAINFGVMARLRGCAELATALRATKSSLPKPRPRSAVISADEVTRLRASARSDGRFSGALAYALVFETTLRLWDVIGQWVPLSTDGDSDVEIYGKKWFGLRWEHVDANLVLRYVPSKTSAKSGKSVAYPLTKAPMVMEELKHWPESARQGPVIINPSTGRPYKSNHFTEAWRKDRKNAGLPKSIWARDLRASGITEARAAGVAIDDAGKVAGHATTKTTSAVYDRAVLEAAERFAKGTIRSTRSARRWRWTCPGKHAPAPRQPSLSSPSSNR